MLRARVPARVRRLGARLPGRVWLLLLVALVLRVVVVSTTLYTPTTLDPADFSRSGLSIAQGQGFPSSNRAPGGGPSAFRPPAYPAFLGVVYWVAGQEAPPAARMVQTLLGVLSVGLTGLIATRIWGRRIGVMALGIAAVAPPLVVLSTALVSESLFVPLMLGAVAAVLEVRRSPHPLRWAIFTGVLLGLAELTRTNAAVLVPPLAWAAWTATRGRTRHPGLAPLAVALATVATVVPWTVRNAVVMHAFIPVSTEIGYTTAGTYNLASRQDNHWPAVWKEAEHGASTEYAPIIFNAEIHRWGEVKLGDALLSASIKDIKHDPAYMLKVLAWNAIRMFHLGELDFGIANLRDTGIPHVPALFEVYGFYPLGVLALLGIAMPAIRRAPGWLWWVPVLLATTLFITGFIRFRAGIDPFLVMLAAVGVIGAQDWWTRRREARAPAADAGADAEPSAAEAPAEEVSREPAALLGVTRLGVTRLSPA